MDIKDKDESKIEQGLCLISFDGGGPGSISQLRTVDEYMTRLAYEMDVDTDELRPADYFDLMAGVGFGGLCALMLGRLHLTARQAMEELSLIGAETFPNEKNEVATLETNMSRLKESIEGVLERHDHPIDLELRDDSNPRCKVVVYAATVATMNHCQGFRTYRSPHRGIDCSFVEAACATMAIPEYFPPITVGPKFMVQTFAGIPYSFNNPMREVFKEARSLFGDDKRVCLALSLGSGQRAVLSNSDQHDVLLHRIARDCETVARELSHQLAHVQVYLRLDVDRGIEAIEISDWHKLGFIISHTEVYLQMPNIARHVDRTSHWLLQRFGAISLGELNGTNDLVQAKYYSAKFNRERAMEFKQMCDIVVQSIEKITLVDAIGNRIPIPMQFTRSYKLLANIIQLYFEDQKPPGSNLVKQGYYQLVSGAKKEVVEPAGWNNIVEPGMTLEMSMVLRDDKQSMACPKCGFLSKGVAKNEWVICSNKLCRLQFQVMDEFADDDTQGPIPSPGQPEKANLSLTDQKSPLGDGVDERMLFRLISVLNKPEEISADSASDEYHSDDSDTYSFEPTSRSWSSNSRPFSLPSKSSAVASTSFSGSSQRASTSSPYTATNSGALSYLLNLFSSSTKSMQD